MGNRNRLTRRIAGMLGKNLQLAKLDQVTDPRDRRGQRWSLTQLLTALLVGLASGCKSLTEVERLTDDMSPKMRRWLRLERRVPDTTLRDMLCTLSPTALPPCLHAVTKAASRRKALKPAQLPFGVIALDGKTTTLPSCDDWYAQRQSVRPLRGAVRSVTATLVSSSARPCIHVTPIPAHTNEMGSFEQALSAVVSAYQGQDMFRMVSYDAGACSRNNASLCRQMGLHYLFAITDAQPTLLNEARQNLDSLDAADAVTEQWLGSSCTIRRIYLCASTVVPEGWQHCHTMMRVDSESVDASGNHRFERRYFVSSLGEQRLSAEQWLHTVRSHWGVETTHQVLDVAFAEDTNPWIRNNPRAMLVVALLRRIAYTMLSLFRSVTQRAEHARAVPWKKLMWHVQLALLVASEQHLEGLKHRPPRPMRA
jgi:predicted transposase YbfD/YdcC